MAGSDQTLVGRPAGQPADQPVDSPADRWITDRPLVLYGVMFVSVVVVYLLSPITNLAGDSTLSFPTAVSMVHSQDLALDEFTEGLVTVHYANWRIDGSRFNFFPWAVSLFLIPAVLGLDLLAALGIGVDSTERVRLGLVEMPEQVTASVVTAASAVLVAVLFTMRSHVGELRTRRFVGIAAGLAFAFGTSAWSITSRAMWQHGPSILLVLVALVLATRLSMQPATLTRERRWWSGTAAALGAVLALACTVRPTNLFPFVLTAVWLLVVHRRAVLSFVTGAAGIAVVWMGVNLASYGSPIAPYHRAGRFELHSQLPEAFVNHLVGPSRGILVFSPALTLAAVIGFVLVARGRGRGLPFRSVGDRDLDDHRADGLEWVAAVSVVLITLAAAGFAENWWGGHTFGPRFMSETLPFLALLSVPAIDRLRVGLSSHHASARPLLVGLVVLCAWSVVVHAQGATMVAAGTCWNLAPRDVDADQDRLWHVSDSQTIRGVRVVVSERSLSAAASPACPGVPGDPDGDSGGDAGSRAAGGQ